MIFGVLNHEKIWHQLLVHLPTSPVYCSHFTSGNPKSHFSTFIHTYFRLFALSQKKTNCYSLTRPPHLKSVTALPCKMHKFFMFLIFSRVLSTNPRYGRVAEASCCDGLNFSRAWWTMQLISGEKDWKHVSVQKMVTLNICCKLACLTFHLPHITTGSFQSQQCQPTTGFFKSHQRMEECNIQVRWKSCAFYKVVQWHFSGIVGNSLFSCEMM